MWGVDPRWAVFCVRKDSSWLVCWERLFSAARPLRACVRHPSVHFGLSELLPWPCLHCHRCQTVWVAVASQGAMRLGGVSLQLALPFPSHRATLGLGCYIRILEPGCQFLLYLKKNKSLLGILWASCWIYTWIWELRINNLLLLSLPIHEHSKSVRWFRSLITLSDIL